MSAFITAIETLTKSDEKRHKCVLNAKKCQIVNIKFLSENSLYLYVHRYEYDIMYGGLDIIQCFRNLLGVYNISLMNNGTGVY